jgi:hypothetical protein
MALYHNDSYKFFENGKTNLNYSHGEILSSCSFSTPSQNSDYVASNERMTGELWTENNVEGRGRGLI